MAQLAREIVGHEEVLERLFGALKKGHLPHALLFSGPIGIGKKKVALALAQTLVCEREQVPACRVCPSCLRMEKRQSEALFMLEPDGQYIKIEQTKEVIRSLALRQWRGSRVVIIDPAEKLNSQAGNSLLKMIEEPPEDTFFILITSSPASVLPTIRSRCQLTRFRPLSLKDLQQVSGAQGWVLQSAQGSVERVQQLSGEELRECRRLAFEALKEVLRNEPASVLELLKETLKDRETLVFLLTCWQQIIRDGRVGTSQNALHSDQATLIEELALMGGEKLDQLYLMSQQMIRDIENHVDRSLTMESGLLKMRQMMGRTS